MKKFKLMALLLVSMLSINVWGETKTSTLTFAAKCSGSGTADDNVVWTITSDAAESDFDTPKGIHYGTGKKAVSYLTLTTSGIDKTITKIVVNASGASGTSATISAKVGDNAFGTQEQSLTSSAANYTFTGSASGKITISLNQTSATKALYVKSIAVTYDDATSSKTLKSITISGTPTKTTYEAGESFEYAGLTATGKYSDNSEENITNSVEWTCSEEPLQQGTTSITVTATKGETFGSTTINGLTVTQALGDKLTLGSTGVTGTSYTAWTNKTGSQGVAKYAGKSAGSNNSIQLNSTSPNGIVSTTSAGLIKKVKVNWNSSTSTSETKKITIYGSNTAYSGSSDLYDNTKQGTSLGEINYNNGGTELEITGEYEYVGIRANKPLYLNSITFVWETALIFNLNGGDGTKPNSITSFPATLPATTLFTKSGYRPNGWNTKADGTGTHYNDGVSFEEPELTTTLYVEWKKVYTMTYNGNSNTEGSVPVDSKSPYDENSSVTVLGNTGNLARTGYTWSGWNTNNSGTGTDRAAGSTFTITSNTTLYAKWTANQTIITLSAPNADISQGTTQVTATYDKAMPTATMPQRTGYTFNGYFDAESGGNKYYNANGTSAKNWDKDVTEFTLHAQWTAKQYDITYKNQGNTNFTGTHETGYPQKHTYDQTTTLKTATRNGYIFEGWYKEPDCSGEEVKTIGPKEITDVITLYAKWTARTTTVSFDKNTTDDVQNMPTGTIVNTFDAALTTIGVTIPTRVGYTFVGWFDSSSKKYYGVTNEAISASVSKWDKADENITLLAHWTPQVYTITYLDKGGETFTGSWGTHPTQHIYGTVTTLVSPTKAHFDFAGWYLTSDCSGEPLENLAADGYLDNITLYAKWNEHAKYTVTFVDDVQGTNCSSWDMKDTYVNTQIVFHSIGDKTRKAPDGDCVTDHYHFVGWIEDGTTPTKEPDNVIKAGTTSIKITKNVTYKAVWAKEL